MRRRILWTILGVTTFAVLAFFVPAALAVRARVQRSELLGLQREASIVASRIGPDGPVDLEAVGRAVGPERNVALYDTEGLLIAGDGPAVADDVVRAGLAGTFAEGTVGGDLVAAVPVRPGRSGPQLVVRIDEPRGVSDARVRRSEAVLAAAALGVLTVAAVIGTLLARRLSRPVERLQAWAVLLGRGGEVDPPPATRIAELDDLGAALADAGQRVRELLQRERSFSSHVSHQLRTPVAAMRVAVEAELDTPRPDPTDLLYECLRELDRLESTIDSLLALARHDEHRSAWCDLGAIVVEHTDRWRPTLASVGRDLTACAGTHLVHVDPASVAHVLDVLLDNAVVHGRGRVTVKVAHHPAGVLVEVGDEGPRRADTDPFSEAGADTGHGIGLRLARTLAESQRGQLELVDSPTTVFRLTLPGT